MPRYEYTCGNGHSYDIYQKYTASTSHQCMEAPEGVRCRAKARRLFSLPAAAYVKKFRTETVRAPPPEWHTTGQSIYNSNE